MPYICQYSKSTGLFAVVMLFSHNSWDQSVGACRPVKVPPQSDPSTKYTTSESSTASTTSAPSSAVQKGASTPQPKKAKPPAKLAGKPKPKKAPPRGAPKRRQRSPSVSSRTSSEESPRLNLRRQHSIESSKTSQDRSPPRKLQQKLNGATVSTGHHLSRVSLWGADHYPLRRQHKASSPPKKTNSARRVSQQSERYPGGSRPPERERRPSSPSDDGMFGCRALIFVCFVQLWG